MGSAKRSLSEIEVGEVLARPVRTFDGRILLDKGTPFVPEHKRILKMWGIEEVTVLVSGEKEGEDSIKIDKTDFPGRFILNVPLSSVMEDLYRFSAESYAGGCSIIMPKEMTQVIQNVFEPVELEKVLCSLEALPSLPRLVQELSGALSDPLCSPKRIAAIIEKDPSLTMRILRLVNSAFYNFPSRIDHLERAATILGIRQISVVAQSALLLDTFNSIPQEAIDMDQFIRHSIAVGVTGRTIAGFAKLSNSELIYLAGLLHDIGRLFLFVHFPKQMIWLMNQAFQEKMELFQLEKRMLGLDHGEIGARIIAEWNLPLALEKSASFHHHPEKNEWDPICNVVHAADVLVHVMACGCSGERLVPRLNMPVWDKLRIPEDCLPALMMEARSMCTLFCSIINDGADGNV